jgi:hypothetical protein
MISLRGVVCRLVLVKSNIGKRSKDEKEEF